jgi:orotate phosphoribosyltransferase
MALSGEHGRSVPYAFNRKEAKNHGEGGNVVGAPLEGRVLIVDDVITAGTAVRESLEIIRAAGGQPAGVALALDRQERGRGAASAVQELEQQQGLQCVSIVTLAELIEALSRPPDGRVRISVEQLTALRAYQQRYGAA